MPLLGDIHFLRVTRGGRLAWGSVGTWHAFSTPNGPRLCPTPPPGPPPQFPESFLQHVLFRCSCGTCRLSCSVCAAGGHFLLLCRSVGSGEVSSFSPPGRPKLLLDSPRIRSIQHVAQQGGQESAGATAGAGTCRPPRGPALAETTPTAAQASASAQAPKQETFTPQSTMRGAEDLLQQLGHDLWFRVFHIRCQCCVGHDAHR